MAEPLSIVVCGCGGVSHAWFTALQHAPDVVVLGVVDVREEAAAARRDLFALPSARVSSNLEALLEDVKPDIIFDCTVPEARESVVLTALKHGCHVLSEKPMAASMESARRLIAAADEGKFYAVMQNRRFDPRIRALREFLKAGSIGEVTTVNADFYLAPHLGGFRESMRHVLLLDMAIHSFDQARVICGGEPVAVYCHEWNPAGSWYAHGASAVAIFEMSNGVVFTYRGSWCSEGLNTSWECDWRVVGTRGSARWDGADDLRAEALAGDEGFMQPLSNLPLTSPAITEIPLHTRCIHDFLDCVRTGRTPETICTENVKSLAMVFGAIESAESGQRVKIDLP